MPWKESSVMDERLRFLARVLDGEPMTEVCRDFGISRKTGYKIFDRYKEHGLEALSDRSRRPVRFANQLPAQLEARIVAIKREKPHWGARKIRELLIRRLPGDVRVPAKSTIHAVLHRHGLVAPPAPPRHWDTTLARICPQPALVRRFQRRVQARQRTLLLSSDRQRSQRVGIKEVDDGIWIVSFMQLRSRLYRLGSKNLAAPRQPLRPKVVTHVLGTFRYLSLRSGQGKRGGR